MYLELEPVDTLFFRDGRPMQAGAGSGGHGANWPLPTVLHEALRSALLRLSGDRRSPRKTVPGRRRRGSKHPKTIAFVTRDYESLRLVGPLPLRDRTLYLPTPGDVVRTEEGHLSVLAPLANAPARSNFPCPWLEPVAGTVRSGKRSPPAWIPAGEFSSLTQASGRLDQKFAELTLWQTEHRVGIGVDPTTGAAAKGKLYTAEHLRMVGGTSLWLEAELSAGDTALSQDRKGIESLPGSDLTLGGEGRLCRIRRSHQPWPEVPAPPVSSQRLKWVLVTPAVFTGGWRPNWVDVRDGRVLLKKGETARRAEEDRLSWRQRVRQLPSISARLVAVCCGKPHAFSGWDLAAQTQEGSVPGAPKRTLLAVPAGSVYYFEADTREDARALAAALHGRRRSDYFGEKGMGFGFCGLWEWLRLQAPS
ncbi:MAG: type III-B CRISPR module-associated Cmr3 family protein [Acidobacteriota bacterium]